MANDRHIKDNLPTPSHRRRSLYNITNLSLSASWAANSREDLLLKGSGKSNDFQLREEISSLKKLLREKEAALAEQTSNLEQLQREFLIQLRRQAQVNEEIISYNSRLSREGGQLRDQLKLLQHEYCQMTVAYRIRESESQAKLTEAQDQLAKYLQDTESKRPTDEMTSILTKKPRNGVRRRHSTAGNLSAESEDLNNFTESGRSVEEVGRRVLSRSSTGGLAAKESTIRTRSQQLESSTTICASKQQHHLNRYSDVIGLEPMIEGCEEDSSQEAMSVASSTSEDSACGLNCSKATSSRMCTGESGASVRKTMKGLKMCNDEFATQNSRSSVPNSNSVPHFSRRASSTGNGRPTRKAAENVASYREPLLNTKMRRP